MAKRILAALCAALLIGWLWPDRAIAQQPQQVVPCVPATSAAGFTTVCVNATTATPFPISGPVTATPATPAAGTAGAGYPPGSTPTTAFATGTTAGTTATIAANATKFNYVCGIHVEAGTATAAITVPVTITGLQGGTFTTAVNSPVTAATATAGPIVSQVFTPCLPSSAVNTAVAVVAGALGAGGVNQNANIWGYQQ